jgi:hypothetical protein
MAPRSALRLTPLLALMTADAAHSEPHRITAEELIANSADGVLHPFTHEEVRRLLFGSAANGRPLWERSDWNLGEPAHPPRQVVVYFECYERWFPQFALPGGGSPADPHQAEDQAIARSSADIAGNVDGYIFECPLDYPGVVALTFDL